MRASTLVGPMWSCPSTHIVVVCYLCAYVLSPIDATISKSDRGSKRGMEGGGGVLEVDIRDEYDGGEHDVNRLIARNDWAKATFLDGHDKLDISTRKFQAGPTLGYVTPWNNHGYDVAKWAAKKFTHIAPVWFQLKSGAENGMPSCTFGGTHDIDRGWMQDIIANNSEAKIVPRILFEHWPEHELRNFITDVQTQHRCGRAMVNFLQRNEMSGAVVEIWLQLMQMTQGTATEYIMEIVESWASLFAEAGLVFVLPIPPPLTPSGEQTALFTPELVKRMLQSVTYLNVMAYDHPGPGVAPIYWVEANLRYLIDIIVNAEEGGIDTSKILLGLNFYGFDRSGGRINDAILGKRFVELLAQPDSHVEFDEEVGEHVVRWSREGVAYFPSRESLALRLKLAQELGVGVAIWELGQGLDYFTSVL